MPFCFILAIRSGDYYMFDEFEDELDSIVEKDNELSDDSLEDSDKTDTDKYDYQVIKFYYKMRLYNNYYFKVVFVFNLNCFF